jgi:hypothetical protein
MHMVYVRLPRFDKTEEECKTDIERLFFSFKNAGKLNEVPRSFTKPEFKRLFEIAKKKGRLEGEAVGMKKGMEKGQQEIFALWEKGVPIAEAKRKLGLGRKSR